MKIFVFVILLTASCCVPVDEKHGNEKYMGGYQEGYSEGYADANNFYDDHAIVVDKGTNGELGRYLLIQRIRNKNQYTELNAYNWQGLKGVNGSPLWHFTKVGDTLYFKHINKNRFWTP